MFIFLRRKGKKDRKQDMAKNLPRRGKSMRNGNCPSPYTKYNKSPYKYMFKERKVVDINPATLDRKSKREYLIAAE